MASARVIQSVSKRTVWNPKETANFIASDNAVASASKTVIEDGKNADFAIKSCPSEFRKQIPYPTIVLWWKIAASTLHFITPRMDLYAQ
ncbi:hypothetical protein MtrunA17_Chr3g0095361 [Medicago truncatula]|uniref:Uncharacterized protein n=1 Tax=Medicago truncatula TaxID=3880 RepID=A0A396IM67_MEDTR|nr:hypothetical protein MtrunA17_Chr3g0095361 [Medicago truncatula]